MGGFLEGLMGQSGTEHRVSLSSVNKWFANSKDAQGKPVQKMDALSFLQLLQMQRADHNDREAGQLAQMVAGDIQANQIMASMLPGASAFSIAGLDNDASSYSPQDFWQLSRMGVAPDEKRDFVDRNNYGVLQALRAQSQAQQMVAQSQQTMLRLTQNQAAFNGGGSTAGSSLPGMPSSPGSTTNPLGMPTSALSQLPGMTPGQPFQANMMPNLSALSTVNSGSLPGLSGIMPPTSAS